MFRTGVRLPSPPSFYDMKQKKKCPFKKGQRVRLKDSKDKDCGLVMSSDWVTIGNHRSCKIPGGPLIIEGYILVQWTFKNGKRICMDKFQDLELCT